MKRLPPRSALPLFALAALASLAGAAAAEEIPIEVGGKDKLSARIEPVNDVDEFALFLLAGDTLKVAVSDTGPVRNLQSRLSLFDPQDADVTPSVLRQGSFRPTFRFTATSAGVHRIRVAGASSSQSGHYQVKFNVKRGRPAKQVFADAAGGSIDMPILATHGAQLTIKAKTKKGGLDLTGVRGPSGDLLDGFDTALKASSNRRSAKVKKLLADDGNGTYTLEGAYDAGSSVKIAVKVQHADTSRNRELFDLEPEVDPFFTPFPDRGVAANASSGLDGTLLTVSGRNFVFDPGETDDDGNNITTADDTLPSFTLGGRLIPPSDLVFNGAQYQFRIPEGLPVSTWHDLLVVNSDGQGDLYEDAFFVVPPPRALLLSASEAGPAGGRRIRITGADFRSGSVVLIDDLVVQPDLLRADFIDVTLPPHDPGTVDVTVRDPFGQTSVIANELVYLDRGTNDITSIAPDWLQGIGGQIVTVTGVDFAADSRLSLDGQEIDATLVSSTEMTFVAPQFAGGTFDLEVRDSVDQANSVAVQVRSFVDDTDAAIPTPRTTSGSVDGWRATSILRGDVNGDGDDDLVLLRSEAAFGNDAGRSRIRVLLGDGAGNFTDDTANAIPAVSGDEDWRARAGVLADLDGQNGPDIAIVTSDAIDSGNRSSLRVLFNDGSGGFTDGTTTSIPAVTTYGDTNQGIALAAVRIDAGSSLDLVVTHTDRFVEVVVTPPPPPDPNNPPDPNDPPPQGTVETFYHAGTRVLLNDGNGVFTRDDDALPDYTAADGHHFEGDAMVSGDVDGDGDNDLVITRDDPIQDPSNASAFFRAAFVLRNTGGTFTDVSAASLPAVSGVEYLQGDRLVLRNIDSDAEPELFIVSDLRLVDPTSGTPSSASALRLFDNDGNGVFSAPTVDPMPAANGLDHSQAGDLDLADLNGDGELDIVLISGAPPNAGERGLRVLVWTSAGYQRGEEGLPSQLGNDNLRGQAVVAFDVDEDGDPDIVLSRSEADESVRNTRVLLNPAAD